jgi:hypothetical protein
MLRPLFRAAAARLQAEVDLLAEQFGQQAHARVADGVNLAALVAQALQQRRALLGDCRVVGFACARVRQSPVVQRGVYRQDVAHPAAIEVRGRGAY